MVLDCFFDQPDNRPIICISRQQANDAIDPASRNFRSARQDNEITACNLHKMIFEALHIVLRNCRRCSCQGTIRQILLMFP